MTLPDAERLTYATAEPEERYRLQRQRRSEPRGRTHRQRSRGERVLVIGQYLDQLAELGELLDAPVVTGQTPVKERQVLFEQFRTGELLTPRGVQGGEFLPRPA